MTQILSKPVDVECEFGYSYPVSVQMTFEPHPNDDQEDL